MSLFFKEFMDIVAASVFVLRASAKRRLINYLWWKHLESFPFDSLNVSISMVVTFLMNFIRLIICILAVSSGEIYRATL